MDAFHGGLFFLQAAFLVIQKLLEVYTIYVQNFVGLSFRGSSYTQKLDTTKVLTQRHFSHHEIWSIAKEYGKNLCVHGYHVYQDIWEAAVGETLVCSSYNYLQ